MVMLNIMYKDGTKEKIKNHGGFYVSGNNLRIYTEWGAVLMEINLFKVETIKFKNTNNMLSNDIVNPM